MSPPKAFELAIESTEGEIVRLADFKGKKIVLFFYPKADTSGCTSEALDFKEHYEEFQKCNAQIIGISKDPVKKNKNFKDKYELPFLLLSDVETTVCNAYGVYKEKSMYGRKYMGIERSTFIIDEKGNIVKEYRKVKVKGHVSEVLESLRKGIE